MNKTRQYLSLCALATILVAASTAVAQSAGSKTTTPTAASATKANPATAPSGHVDQWPKATGQADAKSSGHATEKLDVVEYKDGEDGTMHTRPGNKATQTPASALPPTAPTGPPATDADAKKHIANVKYGDRQAAPPALDAASKDAAKSVVNPRDPHTGQASGK